MRRDRCGISTEDILQPEAQRLRLIIGIGFSGLNVIKETLRIADERVDETYSEYCKMIAVDPFASETECLRHNGVKTLDLRLLGAKDRLKEDVREMFFGTFVPKNYDTVLLHHEDVPDRMTAKIKLYDYNPVKGAHNDEILRRIISDLFEKEWDKYKTWPVDIIVAACIAEDCELGSGTFMDIAAIAKDACPDPENARTTGFLLMPDTADRFYDTEKALRYNQSCGFAALKELESKMSMTYEPNAKELILTHEGEIEISKMNRIFDYPYLVSGNYDKAVLMIAETLVDMCHVVETNYLWPNVHTIRQNKISMKNVAPNGVLLSGMCPEDSYAYGSIGIAKASLPEKVIIPNIIGKVGTTCIGRENMSRAEFEKQICFLLGFEEGLKVSEDSLWEKLIWPMMVKNAPLQDNPCAIEYDQLVDGDWKKYIDGFRVNQVGCEATVKMVEELKAFYTQFSEKAVAVMKQYGFRAIKYLYTGGEDKKDISISNMLEKAEEHLKKLPKGIYPGKIPAANFTAWIKRIISQREMKEWKDRAAAAAQADVYYATANNMVRENGIWYSEMKNRVGDFIDEVGKFAEVIEKLTELYKNYGKTLDEADFQTFSETTNDPNGLNLCSDAHIFEWIKSRITKKTENIDVQTVRERLINDFFENREAWLTSEWGITRKQFDRLMSRSCRIGSSADNDTGMKLEVPDYFDEVLSHIDTEEQITLADEIVKNILDRLLYASKPALKLRDGIEESCVRVIFLPDSMVESRFGTVIVNAFKKNLTGINDHVCSSGAVDEIVCYQFYQAVGLSELEELDKWEGAYGEYETLPTLHLNNGERQTGLSWIHYPSINLRRYEGDFSTAEGTIENRYRANVFAKKVEAALEYGIIEEEVIGHRHQFFINILPEDWTNLDTVGYKECDERGKLVLGRKLFEYLKSQNPDTDPNFRRPILLTGSPFFDSDGYDFSEIIELKPEAWDKDREYKTAKEYMMRALRKNTYLYQRMEETLERMHDIFDEIRMKNEELTSVRLREECIRD